MTSKISYIKKAVNYMIGGAVLVASLSSFSFGVPKENNKAGLELSLGESEVNKDLEKNEAGYYLIKSKVDLEKFTDKVNNGEYDAKGMIMNDIYLNIGSVIEDGELKKGNFKEWTPIGTKEHPFKGEFEGNGKTINGLYINKKHDDYQGFFGYIEEGGKVSNIKINRSYIKGKEGIGGISGKNEGEIINCITADSIIEGNNIIGGNVGENGGTITDCKNEGKVIGNNIEVIGGNMIGGNVGLNDKGTIKGDCNNNGNVTGQENNVGGNVGCNYKGTIEGKCNNNGNVTGQGEFVGGNVGKNNGTILGECENSKKVTGEEKVGGNVGYNYKGTITGDCKNKGIVIGDNVIGGNVGGNVGTITGESNNEGKVTGKKNVGGNVGWNGEKGEIKNCNNGEAVNGEINVVKGKDNVGGNIGCNEGKLIGIYNNAKDIEGKNNVGGNIGYNKGKLGGTFNNSGVVTGEEYVEGNVGFHTVKLDKMKFQNTGKVIRQEKYEEEDVKLMDKVSIEKCNDDGKVIEYEEDKEINIEEDMEGMAGLMMEEYQKSVKTDEKLQKNPEFEEMMNMMDVMGGEHQKSEYKTTEVVKGKGANSAKK